jgi:hypothetical protein
MVLKGKDLEGLQKILMMMRMGMITMVGKLKMIIIMRVSKDL